MHRWVAGVLAVTIVSFALTSHFAIAATTVQINDPITDAVQLWSAIATSIDTAAHQLAADLAYLDFPAHLSRAAASTTPHLNPPPVVTAHTQRSASLAAAAASISTQPQASDPSATSPTPSPTPSINYDQTSSIPPINVFAVQSALGALAARVQGLASQISTSATSPASPDVESQVAALQSAISRGYYAAASPPLGGGAPNTIAAASAIDQLSGTAITNPTITGGSIANASFSGGPIAANSLSVSGNTSLSGDLNVGGNFSAGSISFSLASSTGIVATNATTTNATSTNLFATLANFGSAIANTISASVANVVGLTATNATTTNLAVTGTGYFAGHVGIGTTSPFTTLGVNGNGYFSGTLFGDVSSANFTAFGGTVARSLAARGADVVNVEDFGARGDGVTNNSSAIAAAQAAAQAAGKAIFFPDGVWAFGTPIIYKASVPILCNSHNSVLKLTAPATTADYAILIDGSSGAVSRSDNADIENCTLQSVGGGIHLKEAHRSLIENVYVPRGVAGPAFFNEGSMLVMFTRDVQTTNGTQINPSGAIPTYGFLMQDSANFPINATQLIMPITEGAQIDGINISSNTFGSGYFTITGGASEGSGNYDLNLNGVMSSTIHGLHIESGHGAPNADTAVNIQNSSQVSIYGEQVSNVNIASSKAVELNSVLVSQLNIDAASTDTIISDSQINWNNGYTNDLGVNTRHSGNTSDYWASYGKVGDSLGMSRNVLDANTGLERWVGSPMHPDGFYSYGGASVSQLSGSANVHSGSYAAEITAVGTAQQGMAYTVPVTQPGDWISVSYWMKKPAALSLNPGFFVQVGSPGYSEQVFYEQTNNMNVGTWYHFCRTSPNNGNDQVVFTCERRSESALIRRREHFGLRAADCPDSP